MNLRNLNLKLTAADLMPSPSYSQNIGLGTTGLGEACNRVLARDRDLYIKTYIQRKDKERAMSASPTSGGGGAGGGGSRSPAGGRKTADDSGKGLRARLEQQRAARIVEIVKEWQANEVAIKEAKKREAEIKAAEVEREKAETRQRREQQRQERYQKQIAFQQKIQEEIHRDREIFQSEQEWSYATMQAKHEEQKRRRALSKQRAERERKQREEEERKMVEQTRKKLKDLTKMHTTLQKELLQSKQQDASSIKKGLLTAAQRRKEAAEKEQEKFRQLVSSQKDELYRNLKNKKEQELERKRVLIATLKQERGQSPNSDSGRLNNTQGSGGFDTRSRHDSTSATRPLGGTSPPATARAN